MRGRRAPGDRPGGPPLCGVCRPHAVHRRESTPHERLGADCWTKGPRSRALTTRRPRGGLGRRVSDGTVSGPRAGLARLGAHAPALAALHPAPLVLVDPRAVLAAAAVDP